MIFLFIYLHIFRGLYFSSTSLLHTWAIGVTILLILIATAFLGYVLPWGQISLWGATVITNLLSSVPYLGPTLVLWLWGGSSVAAPTLRRFFALHFLLPFILFALIIIHIALLHQSGSNNPLGLKTSLVKLPFHPFHSIKDILGVIIALIIFFFLVLRAPNLLGDPENFRPANPINSPIHIKPEWYYLFAYAILRAIPNKLGGVIALLSSVIVLYFLPFLMVKSFKSNQFYPLNTILFFFFLLDIRLLTWIGARGVEPPYIVTGQILTILYFINFLLDPLLTKVWEQKLLLYRETIKVF